MESSQNPLDQFVVIDEGAFMRSTQMSNVDAAEKPGNYLASIPDFSMVRPNSPREKIKFYGRGTQKEPVSVRTVNTSTTEAELRMLISHIAAQRFHRDEPIYFQVADVNNSEALEGRRLVYIPATGELWLSNAEL